MDKTYEITQNKFFTTDEIKRIFQYSKGLAAIDRAEGRMTWCVRWMLVHLVMHSGLRVSEVANLRIKRVVLNKESYIHVYQSKRGKSRDVYIDRELAEHLQDYLTQKQTWNQSVDPSAYLFSGRGDKPLTTVALYISFKKAVVESGCRKELSIHSARHTYATLLYYRTKDLRAVQKQLGHSSTAMTALYSDIMPEIRSEIANSILDNETPQS